MLKGNSRNEDIKTEKLLLCKGLSYCTMRYVSGI
jgi:hypothetical protein